jgi:predicted glycosyl hydrolase (DUF1957 family)
MANILGVDLKLDQEYIKASVEDIVKSGIVQALGDPERIVKTAVDQTINMKVDRDGKPCSSSYGSVSYLNWLANKTVQDVVMEAMTDIVKEQADTIKELIKKQLSSKQFLNDVSGQFVKSLLDNTASTWKTPITVRFEKPKDSDY